MSKKQEFQEKSKEVRKSELVEKRKKKKRGNT